MGIHTNAAESWRRRALGVLGLLSALGAFSGLLRAEAASLADCDRSGHFLVLSAAQAGAPADASAAWLNQRLIRWPGASASGRFRLVSSSRAQIVASPGSAVTGVEASVVLSVSTEVLPPETQARFVWLGQGVQLAVADADRSTLETMLTSQVVLVQEDQNQRVLRATNLQWAGHYDERFATAETSAPLGATLTRNDTTLRLWAPSAQAVALCLHDQATGPATRLLDLERSADTGIWQTRLDGDHHGRFYTYLVDVPVRGTGLVRNRVTDPYSVGLSANSVRTALVDLDRADTRPEGWPGRDKRLRARHAVDMVIYELRVRDFSVNDDSVPAPHRGKYLAFTHGQTHGMRHLKSLADAGLTDVHLLPVFDLATVPERGCVTPTITGSGDSTEPQAMVASNRANDCFNWGYDPFHFNAPEGSFATDADDPVARIREFREMVQSLNRSGLRVGMDVVYNHTSAAGQDARSVLDRVVPGYYQRLNAQGAVETSTCCQNTATEHRMMARLMIDSTVLWAKAFGIESFRFDLMAHQPRAVMERLQSTVDAAVGRPVQLLGEGWNFGEVANGARFVQASQLSLNGSGIGTFSDRARDAVRGGSAMDNDVRLVSSQGYVNGLVYDRNAQGSGQQADLLRAADLVRVGLAGSIRSFEMTDYTGQVRRLEQITYSGNQPAGYVLEPAEVVNYVENHDNQTLFDINAFKLPLTTSRHDRARVQMLAAAITLFSQGTSYFHAGIDLLRSKSMDRNSYDSGDWFNRIDWTGQDNYFGTGLPPQAENGGVWSLMRPRLASADIKPAADDITWTRSTFQDLLRIRASTGLFRLRSAEAIKSRLRFANTGPAQVGTLLVGRLDGTGIPGERFRQLA
ncbi:MAG: DUF3372 domain-containing protein [Ahniella sp.]|nr:DUF3372 domain-containing protein [Ahniella sp.]